MNRSHVMLSAVAVALCAGLQRTAAQDEATLSRGYLIEVSPGDTAAFEAAMKKQIQWYKDNKETWHWHCWQWETGPDTGNYTFRSPGHTWKDFDDRGERSLRAGKHFREVVGPHVQSMHGNLGSVMTKMSHWPDDLGEIPMVSVYEFNVHYGMGEEFIDVVTKIHEAILESNWGLHYAWVAAISGVELPTFWLVIPHRSWADMTGPDTPLWVMVAETVGRAEAQSLKSRLKSCVRKETLALARFRQELSYMPAAE